MNKAAHSLLPGGGDLSVLTPRELEVLSLIGQGKRIAEIAQQLHRSAHTIKSHRAAISKKLNISDRVGLARYSIHAGLVPVAGGAAASADSETVVDCMRLCYGAFHSERTGSAFCSVDSTIRHMNPVACEMLGLQGQPTIGIKLSDSDRPHLLELADAVRQVASIHRESTERTLEVVVGGERTLSAVVTALSVPAGPSESIWISLRDVTAKAVEMRTLRRQLADLEIRAEQSAAEYASTLEMLRHEMVLRQRVDSRLKEVLAGTGVSSGEGFFRLLVRSLARSLGVSHAFVIERIGTSGRETRLHVVAAWSEDQPVDVVDFPTLEGPCVVTLSGGQCHIPTSVHQLFPNSGLLKQVHADSYLGVPLTSAGGSPMGVLCVLDQKPMPDVSEALPVLRVFASRATAELERLHAQAALGDALAAARKNEEQYRAMVDSQADFLSRCTPDSTLTFVNQSLSDACGATPEQLIGKQWLSMVHESERARSLATLASVTPQRPVVMGVNRLALESGLRLVEWRNRGFFDRSGACVEIQAVGRDVTDRVLAELALGTCPGATSPDGKSVDVGVFLTDSQLKRPVVNSALKRILGRTGQREETDRWHELVHADDRVMVQERWHSETQAGRCFTMNFRIVRPDGAAVAVRFFAAPQFDDHGQMSGYLGSIVAAETETQ